MGHWIGMDKYLSINSDETNPYNMISVDMHNRDWHSSFAWCTAVIPSFNISVLVTFLSAHAMTFYECTKWSRTKWWDYLEDVMLPVVLVSLNAVLIFGVYNSLVFAVDFTKLELYKVSFCVS